MSARCNTTDLIVDECAHCQGTPEISMPTGAFVPVAREGTWVEAAYRSECGCGCGRMIQVGEDIVLADVAGDETWVLVEHARTSVVAP